MKPVKILYLIGTLERGGTEGQLVELATRLDPNRFRPVVCSLSLGGPYVETLREAGVPVHIVGFRGFKHGLWTVLYLPRIAEELRRLTRLMRAEQPAIVHGFLFWAYIIGTFAAKAVRVPIVVASRRSLGWFKAQKPHYLRLERLANRWTDLLVANSEAVKQDVMARERMPSAKIRVVYNGIDADRYARPPDPILREELGIPAGAPVIGVVANLIHYKGHLVLLEACRRIREARPDTRVLLVGEGPCRKELHRRAANLGVAEMVCFLGSRRDVPELLAQISVAALPSLEEGFPNAVLEAMAAGKPVVASRVGGVPEAVRHGETGLLVPPGDPDALAEGLLALLADPKRAAVMGRAGKERARVQFDMDRMVREMEAIYEELLSAARH